MSAPGARPPRFRRAVLQWIAMALFVLTALVFVANQTQQPAITFAENVSRDTGTGDPRSRAEPPPTYESIVAEYGSEERFVVLPGGAAVMDRPLVIEWLDKAGASRVVVLPPLHPDADSSIDVPDDVVLVTGTEVSFGGYSTTATDFESVRAVMGARDVTSPVVALLAHAAGETDPEAVRDLVTRAPTAEEAAVVIADLQADGIAFVSGAEPFDRPATEAFTAEPLYVIAPPPAAGAAAVDYSEAVVAAFPGRPVISMTGLWIDFTSDEIAEIEPAITASFYGQLEERLKKHDYPQRTILAVALDRVEQFRASGMFDRAMPYVAPDPVKLTMPALPWVCAGLAAVLLGASLLPRGAGAVGREGRGLTADLARRFAGLSDLAVEVSGLVHGDARPAFVRATRALSETRDAVAESTATNADVAALLDRATDDLTEVADRISRADYAPARFLARSDS